MGRIASLSAKKYGTPYFSVESELQNIPEAAPEASSTPVLSSSTTRNQSIEPAPI
jgi:hypothetical protein